MAIMGGLAMALITPTLAAIGFGAAGSIAVEWTCCALV